MLVKVTLSTAPAFRVMSTALISRCVPSPPAVIRDPDSHVNGPVVSISTLPAVMLLAWVLTRTDLPPTALMSPVSATMLAPILMEPV